MNLGSPAGLNVTGLITLSAWIDPTSSSGSYQDIVGRGYTTSPDAETMLRINSGDYQVVAWNGTNYEASAAVPASDLNTWVQLVGVYNGTDWLLYRDGTLLASTASTVGALSVAANWMIGSSGISTDPRYFNGSIGDVRIYNVALSRVAGGDALRLVLPAHGGHACRGQSCDGHCYEYVALCVGASVAGTSSLTYTWATTGTPPAPVTFSANGTTAAASTTATFTKAGTYAFQVTITDGAFGRTVTSSVSVTVNQTLTSITVSPPTATLAAGSAQFTGRSRRSIRQRVDGATGTELVRDRRRQYHQQWTLYASLLERVGHGVWDQWRTGRHGKCDLLRTGPVDRRRGAFARGGSGNWKDSATGDILAAAPGVQGIVGDTALLSSAGGYPLAGGTITLNSANPNLAGLSFNSGSNGFTIATGEPGGTLTFDNGTASADIAIAAGSQTISTRWCWRAACWWLRPPVAS